MDIFSVNNVVHDIWSAICGAKLIIGDCTGRNPNVFYELGIAHTLGKPIVLTTQHSHDVPFDVSHVRYLQYDPTVAGMRQFGRALTETIQALGLL